MIADPARYAQLRSAAVRLGYWHPAQPLEPARPYDLFLFGVRGPAPAASDRFDDTVGVAWCDELGHAHVEEWAATTDPGLAAVEAPSNPAGVATLCPGQLRRVWVRGLHHGLYPCLVPVPGAVMPVWRGKDREHVWLDARGIQLHHAGEASTRVGRWSEGCQVLQRAGDLLRLLALLDEQRKRGLGDVLTFTLFTSDQVR